MVPLLEKRNARFNSPFCWLDQQLAGVAPNPQLAPIVMPVGEPQDAPPAFLANAVVARSG